MADPARLAVLGGTFDPIHRGHLDPLRAVAAPMAWDRVLLIPAATQPFKSDRPPTRGHHRWAMAALATAGEARFALSDVELRRGRISYTVETLEELRARHPGSALEWIVGDDNLALLGKWRGLDRILELANFVVLRRGGGELPADLRGRVALPDGRPRAGAIVLAESPLVPIAATEIRARVARGEPISGMVAPAVEEYIAKYGLYRAEEQTWAT